MSGAVPRGRGAPCALFQRASEQRVAVPGRERQRGCVKPDTPLSTKPGRQTMMRERETVAASSAVTYPWQLQWAALPCLADGFQVIADSTRPLVSSKEGDG
jgi:hypothetical protein